MKKQLWVVTDGGVRRGQLVFVERRLLLSGSRTALRTSTRTTRCSPFCLPTRTRRLRYGGVGNYGRSAIVVDVGPVAA